MVDAFEKYQQRWNEMDLIKGVHKRGELQQRGECRSHRGLYGGTCSTELHRASTSTRSFVKIIVITITIIILITSTGVCVIKGCCTTEHHRILFESSSSQLWLPSLSSNYSTTKMTDTTPSQDKTTVLPRHLRLPLGLWWTQHVALCVNELCKRNYLWDCSCFVWKLACTR